MTRRQQRLEFAIATILFMLSIGLGIVAAWWIVHGLSP